MTKSIDRLMDWRAERLQRLLDEKFGGVKADLGRALGYGSGAFVRQMLAREKPISEKTVAAIHAIRGCAGWMDPNPDLIGAPAPASEPTFADSLAHVLRVIDAAPEAPRILAKLIIGRLISEDDNRDELIKALANHLDEPGPPPTWREAASAWAIRQHGAPVQARDALSEIDQTFALLMHTWREQHQEKQKTKRASREKQG